MSTTPNNNKDEFETLFSKSVTGLFASSIAVSVKKQTDDKGTWVTLQITSFNGKAFRYNGGKPGINLLIAPKNTKKLIAVLTEALELQWDFLRKLGYQTKEEEVINHEY